jgi:hypothetical protein
MAYYIKYWTPARCADENKPISRIICWQHQSFHKKRYQHTISLSGFMRCIFAAFKRVEKAQVNRERNAKAVLEIPPMMIVSTTDRCNLACAGCYACAN